MGISKFLRHISERYPCLSEFVEEYQVPEFDNLYLDMNGIIHNCSHPDYGNPQFCITEEKIFADTFHYIEFIFHMIKPQKVFFMAIDGVAPMAKMIEQRRRRFKTAKDAQKPEDVAIKNGDKLPTECQFDSSCITPGTEFMVQLHEQLKYFVVKKISQDPLWRRCQVILSGHETPGEGEHKIMDFIRYKRSQPDYDPNTRHCLYGLDSDLIILGLCTHDPHFSLLREEIIFDKKATSKRNCVPEKVRFPLMHLSLMREYLEMEFAPLKTSLKYFDFDIEKIIDDWVLMVFLVGNDFIPHLPNMHIANGILPVLYKAYMEVLPTLDGFINEGGILNLRRFEILLKKLSEIDIQNFNDIRGHLLYMDAKAGRKVQPSAENTAPPKQLQMCKLEAGEEALNSEVLEVLEPGRTRNSGLIQPMEDECLNEDKDNETDEDDEFRNFKKNYYIHKLKYEKVTPEVMRSQAENYVKAIQWNLHYYYKGLCSWSWYYPHHYAPYVSDIRNFQDLKFEFHIGKPFKPFEQLLAILPIASKNLLPKCYQKLMTDENSSIKKYYPENFEIDLNGKLHEWEGVVLVPFIDEDILLDAIKSCNDQLNSSESKRNTHGPMLCYKYTEADLGVYEAPEYFPQVCHNHAEMQPITIEEIRVPVENLIIGAYPGILMDVYYPGFPTFKHLEYEGYLKEADVKERASKGDNMIVIVAPPERALSEDLPLDLLGKTVYVGWPHLTEAKVVALVNSKEKYSFVAEGAEPDVEASLGTFDYEVENVVDHYNGRLGIEFGKVNVLVKVRTMIGQKYMITSNGRISLQKIFSEGTSNYPLQLIVAEINVFSEIRDSVTTLEKLFPFDSTCFLLSPAKYYGSKATIKNDDKIPEGRLCVSVMNYKEPNLTRIKNIANKTSERYRSLYYAANQSGVTKHMFNRITGTFFVTANNKEGGLDTVAIGLDLRFNKKNLEVPGYSKKISGDWFYSDAAIELVVKYANEFPEIFEFLSGDVNRIWDNDVLAEEIFPIESEERIKSVETWLESQAYAEVERRACDSALLDKKIVEEIEKTIDNFTSDESLETILYLKPNLLYRAELCFGNLVPDSSVEVQLFDRIVNVRANHSVPLGLRGTVIGISKVTEDSKEQLYDIVFDEKFEGGIEINCSSGRGYRLPLNSFINISNGERQYQPQTGYKARKEEQVNWRQPNFNNSQNGRNGNFNFSNSAFAKFNSTSPSYNAVPPFMPNGEPIYDSYNNFNRQNYHCPQPTRQKYPNYNNPRFEQPYDVMKQNKQSPSNYYMKWGGAYENKSRQQPGDSKAKSPPKKTDFMPVFKKAPDTVEETADALKKLLNIGTETDAKSPGGATRNDKPKPQKKTPEPKKELQPSPSSAATVEKDHAQIDSVPNKLATVQLLSYYQSKGLGLPRYQYVTSELGTQCQIKLPNRAIIIGTPGRSREEASEIVAELALRALNLKLTNKSPHAKEQKHPKESPKKIPTPPKQWWSQEQRGGSHQHEKTNTKSSRNNANTWKGMIPLQAVKKEKANSSSKNKTAKGNKDEMNKKTTKTVLSENSDTSNAEKPKIIEKQDKPRRRERKMRIAANFGVNN